MRLASGIAPILEMLAGGVKVGIGVDGSASNDGSNLLAEARQAMLLARLRAGLQGASLTGEEAPPLMSARQAPATTRGGSGSGRADIGSWNLANALISSPSTEPSGVYRRCMTRSLRSFCAR
jgi:cytosine/adenosine deaminase-related metal-dependent hydrolase